MYPISNYSDEIVNSVRTNHVTIIVGETGCGKSTQILPILEKHVRSAVVTQPRRLAAISLAKRVADEQKWSMPGKIGYVTGTDKCFTPSTSMMFCTDGVEVCRTLCGRFQPDVLVLDEIHEMNMNMEVLMAWQKRAIGEGSQTRLVIMSASMDPEALSRYFWNAPIITVEGRTYPVTDVTEKFETSRMFLKHCIDNRRNVLVFVPGKAEIEQYVRNDLAHYHDPYHPDEDRVVVCPLHAEMSYEDQLRAFGSHDRPKIVVATNVAQTSITIPDIDAVVDTQLERSLELQNGSESLVLQQISKSCSIQRMGRAGRVKPGLYYNAFHEQDIMLHEEQRDHPIPEIQRLSLDKNILRLMNSGIDPLELEFFHDPGRDSIFQTQELLQQLGAIDRAHQVTPIGKQMLHYPLDARSSRIMIEAKKLGIQFTMAAIMACIQSGGIFDHRLEYEVDHSLLPRDFPNDLEQQLWLFNKARSYDAKNPCPFIKYGINRKSFFQALNVYKQILHILFLQEEDRDLEDAQNQDTQVKTMRIRRAFLSGMRDNLIIRNYTKFQFLYPKDNMERGVNVKSIYYKFIHQDGKVDPMFLVGMPYNLQYKDKRSGMLRTIHLINWPMSVTAEDIKATFPDMPFHQTYQLQHPHADQSYYQENAGYEPMVAVKQVTSIDGRTFSRFMEEEYADRFEVHTRRKLKALCKRLDPNGEMGMYKQAHEMLMAQVLKRIVLAMGCYIGLPSFSSMMEEWISRYCYTDVDGYTIRPVTPEKICEILGVTSKGIKLKYVQEEEEEPAVEETVLETETVASSDQPVVEQSNVVTRGERHPRVVPMSMKAPVTQQSTGIGEQLSMSYYLSKAIGAENIQFPVSAEKTPEKAKVAKPVNKLPWTNLGKRNYRCVCGRTHRHGKSDTKIVCDKCGDTYTI